MAKVTRMVKMLGRTINVGDFNSIKLEATVEAKLEPNDSVEEVDAMLFDKANKMITEDWAKIKRKRENSDEE